MRLGFDLNMDYSRMALVVEITVKINCSYPNLSEISPDIIVLHLFQELFLQGMTFSHSLPCKYKTVNRIHIPFPFIGELFFQRMKSQKKIMEIIQIQSTIYTQCTISTSSIIISFYLLNFNRSKLLCVEIEIGAKSRRGESCWDLEPRGNKRGRRGLWTKR